MKRKGLKYPITIKNKGGAMIKLQFPYSSVYTDLTEAMSQFYTMPRKEAIDWKLINMIEAAIKLLQTNKYFHQM